MEPLLGYGGYGSVAPSCPCRWAPGLGVVELPVRDFSLLGRFYVDSCRLGRRNSPESPTKIMGKIMGFHPGNPGKPGVSHSIERLLPGGGVTFP